MSSLKVLHLIDSGGFYGAEMMLLNLMAAQQDEIYPILGSIGLKGEGEKPIEAAVAKEEIQVQRFRMRRGYSIKGVLSILQFVKHHNIDLVHSHGYKGDIFLGCIPRAVRGFPVISTLHGWTTCNFFSKMKCYELLHKICLRNIDIVTTVNEKSKENLRWLGKRVLVVENGITRVDFDSDSIGSDKDFSNCCKNGFLVGSVGRLSAEKGYSILVVAMKLLRNKLPDAKLVIIGEGPERKKLERMVAEVNLTNSVFLIGYRNNARQYIPFFDVFVLPSFSEGLPITILEAMQAGTPIVATRVGGLSKVLRDGRAGMLVEPGDPSALAEAINKLCDDATLRSRITFMARQICLTDYSLEKMNSKYLKLYRRITLGI